jgi:hypothetical protein
MNLLIVRSWWERRRKRVKNERRRARLVMKVEVDEEGGRIG